jgi:hypothetical protein
MNPTREPATLWAKARAIRLSDYIVIPTWAKALNQTMTGPHELDSVARVRALEYDPHLASLVKVTTFETRELLDGADCVQLVPGAVVECQAETRFPGGPRLEPGQGSLAQILKFPLAGEFKDQVLLQSIFWDGNVDSLRCSSGQDGGWVHVRQLTCPRDYPSYSVLDPL